MDVELNQFQKDLLESVREMKTRQVLPAAEKEDLNGEKRFECAETRRQNASKKLRNSDT
ncbi:hypothetical protein [Pseudomonas sp. dw_612]|uniref:hypothetical protein n=1 Tax=Pseudomonas sp. dw_612 TaxID=2720080 RepID=UPI001BD3A51C|nr:hypothetical protein [Pseudomonas sp. dw_612]